jgi:hypothetical protein
MTFKVKKTNFSLTTKDLTPSESSVVKTPDFLKGFDQPAVADINCSYFELSPSLIAKLGSGALDEKIETAGLETGNLDGGILGQGIEEEMGRYANLGRDHISEATDVYGAADRNSAINRIGAAGSMRMNGGGPETGQGGDGDDYDFSDVGDDHDDYTFELDEDGNVIGYDNDENGDPIESTRENLGPASQSGESTDPTTSVPTSDAASSDSNACPNGLLTAIAAIAYAAGDGAVKGLSSTSTPQGAVAGAAIGALVAEGAIYFSSDIVDDICKNPNPMDDDSEDPNSSGFTDLLGLLGEKDEIINRLRIINPEINPLEETGSNDNSGYVNDSLADIGMSNGGTSTGAWEVNGGDYVGPSSLGSLMNIDLTSTGNDWF